MDFRFLFQVTETTKKKSPDKFSESGAVDISSNPRFTVYTHASHKLPSIIMLVMHDL
jgi:hypothetical protein